LANRGFLRADASNPCRPKLRAGDAVICGRRRYHPGDGEVYRGRATVDEAGITASAPVIRGRVRRYRSAVTGGTRVLSIDPSHRARTLARPSDAPIAFVEGAEFVKRRTRSR
jgi:high-affinity K+ transport system ATPase subunit B